MVKLRTMQKNKVHAELATRWIKYYRDPFTEEGKNYLRPLSIDAINDYLDTIEFLNRKIRKLDEKVKKVVESEKYAKIPMTVPGISYYSARANLFKLEQSTTGIYLSHIFKTELCHPGT